LSRSRDQSIKDVATAVGDEHSEQHQWRSDAAYATTFIAKGPWLQCSSRMHILL